MPDHTVSFQLPHILHEFPADNPVEFLRRIDKVDHPQIYVIRLQPRQQILKSRLYFRQIPRPHILPVLPSGTDVALNDPFLPPSFDGQTDIRADVRFRHPAVQNVDPFLFTGLNDLPYLLRVVALQPLPAQADLADPQAGLSQFSVPHMPFSFLRQWLTCRLLTFPENSQHQSEDPFFLLRLSPFP